MSVELLIIGISMIIAGQKIGQSKVSMLHYMSFLNHNSRLNAKFLQYG